MGLSSGEDRSIPVTAAVDVLWTICWGWWPIANWLDGQTTGPASSSFILACLCGGGTGRSPPVRDCWTIAARITLYRAQYILGAQLALIARLNTNESLQQRANGNLLMEGGVLSWWKPYWLFVVVVISISPIYTILTCFHLVILRQLATDRRAAIEGTKRQWFHTALNEISTLFFPNHDYYVVVVAQRLATNY